MSPEITQAAVLSVVVLAVSVKNFHQWKCIVTPEADFPSICP